MKFSEDTTLAFVNTCNCVKNPDKIYHFNVFFPQTENSYWENLLLTC